VPSLLLAPLVVFGLLGWAFTSDNSTTINLESSLVPPFQSWSHPLGTDPFGRDVLGRLIEGARFTLIVAVVGVAIAGLVGVFVGILAGQLGGWVDDVLMRIVDMQLAVPPILLALLIAAVFRGGPLSVIVTIGVAFWCTYARVLRGETLGIMHRGFIALAVVGGASRWRILRRHILPNVFAAFVVLATLQLGAAVGLESALSFLGLGVQPPNTTWGLMIADGQGYLDTAWWVATFPGVAIALTVLGANLLGDWLRDRLDPTLRPA
jgi:peptide/nickel transport system permease protein